MTRAITGAGRRPSLVNLPRVTALGGGHGLYASLQALRRITDRLIAVVTVADDGGSSGRLRDELDCLPPGDLRMALAALCGDDREGRLWADVLQARFQGTGCLNGHAIGNLLIAGLWDRLGDPVAGLRMVGELLHVRGTVLPMCELPLSIEADIRGLDPLHPDRTGTIHGQATVAKTRGEVRAVRLVPSGPPACPDAVEAIMASDFVVLGPGSWFTSVMPHLLVPQLAEAICTTSARRILTLNIAPADETDGFSPSRHIELLTQHAPDLALDWVIADPVFAANDPVLADRVAGLGATLVLADVAMRDGSPRHDPLRLASAYGNVMSVW
ncbi:MAG: uridine diphosphate-N-acetylglucosamine-binding protein YvcK [Propionibacterium sp.]|nr:uridine diphosphate-N-acetylglucosamine-binding protein YvcK [Propionibacterium sp.]